MPPLASTEPIKQSSLHKTQGRSARLSVHLPSFGRASYGDDGLLRQSPVSRFAPGSPNGRCGSAIGQFHVTPTPL